jgi:hypothetical protein
MFDNFSANLQFFQTHGIFQNEMHEKLAGEKLHTDSIIII